MTIILFYDFILLLHPNAMFWIKHFHDYHFMARLSASCYCYSFAWSSFTIIILWLLLYSLWVFNISSNLWFFTGVNDSKSPQVYRTLLSILADFNTAVVWMVLILLLIINFPTLFSRPLETVSSAPTTIAIIITFTFHIFFNSLERFKYLSIFSLSFICILWSAVKALFH